jgi:hypothetical protein
MLPVNLWESWPGTRTVWPAILWMVVGAAALPRPGSFWLEYILLYSWSLLLIVYKILSLHSLLLFCHVLLQANHTIDESIT